MGLAASPSVCLATEVKLYITFRRDPTILHSVDDQTLYEDNMVNRLVESLNLFEVRGRCAAI